MRQQHRGKNGSPGLISAMSQSSFYPHAPSQVEFKQTHLSYVFLAGQYVYKVKKPVHFPFVDYSTLDGRLHFCREEVRLNRRLAPRVYLDVIPIIARGSQLTLGEGAEGGSDGEVVEYAVKMRRLPEAQMLDYLLAKGSVQREHIHAIAQKLVSFHRVASSDRASNYGTREAIKGQIQENLNEIEPFIGRTIHRKLFNDIKHYQEAFFSAQEGLFERRLRRDKVREGHGDLRAEHICMTDGIEIFDTIEFNEGFRYCDVASDIAFLTMDLDFQHAPELADELRDQYAAKTEDKDFKRLMPFYECHRACVRGKVDTLKSLEAEVPQEEREKALARGQRYFRLAYRYARPVNRPALIIVCGMIATGKSTLAKMLEDTTGFRLKSSDIVRKEFARASPQERFRESYGQGIYSRSFSDKTYAALVDEARKALSEGRGIIVDASFKDARHRELFLKEAESKNIPILFVECQAGEDEIFRRLKAREHEEDQVSDATWEVYLQQRGEFAPLNDIPDQCHLTFDGTMPEDLLSRIPNLLSTNGTY